jgi:regulator of protease activity HflC (stomatin/prohibitin superfamily)
MSNELKKNSPNRLFFRNVRLWIEEKKPTLIVLGILLSLILAFFLDNIVITINPGEAGVLYRRLTTGTVTDHVYPERIHFILPWNRMYIYDVRIQNIQHELVALTRKGLPIHLYLAIRYRPEYKTLGLLHKNIGPDYVSRILLPQIESVLRREIGNLEPEAVYTNQEGVLSNIMSLAKKESSQNFIVVEDIIIRTIVLPEMIRTAIEKKLVEQQRLDAYVFILETAQKEALRKGIEATGIKSYQDIIAQTLSDKLIKWQGVQATLELAKSENAKVVIVGAGKEGLPVILGNQ